jgi:mRNA-degrading endonuclease RelE of RelBE toxin-antitoxin system
MSHDIEITETAKQDLERLDSRVQDTFYSKIESIEKNLGIGATPRQAFDKYLSGNMHPVLQMNLGRDYRAWFIEGTKVDIARFDEDNIYCMMVLTKTEAKKLTDRIGNVLDFLISR